MTYPNEKIVHRAKGIREDGAVSALCFSRPRPIDLRRTTWTNRDEAVTCRKCLAVMNAVRNSAAPDG